MWHLESGTAAQKDLEQTAICPLLLACSHAHSQMGPFQESHGPSQSQTAAGTSALDAFL